jgi:hypothetical protein
VAYRFAQDVDAWLNSGDDAVGARLVETLTTWAANHARLAPAFAQSPRVPEIEPHSRHLSSLAGMALHALGAQPRPVRSDSAGDALLTSARDAHGGTVLAVVDAIELLMTEGAGQ